MAQKVLSERIVIKKKHPELLTFRWQLCDANRRNDNTVAKYGVIEYWLLAIYLTKLQNIGKAGHPSVSRCLVGSFG